MIDKKIEMSLSPSFLRLRRIHEIPLLLWLLMVLDWETTKLLEKLIEGLWWRHSADEIHITIWFLTTTASITTGLILVYCHRKKETFLPMRTFLTYMVSGVAWLVGVFAFFDEVINLDFGKLYHGMGTLVWCVSLGLMAVPYLLWRRHTSTPLLLDAALLSVLMFLSLSLLDYARGGRFWHIWLWRLDWNFRQSFLLAWIIANWGFLAIIRKKKRLWRYFIVLLFNLLLLILNFIVRPTLS